MTGTYRETMMQMVRQNAKLSLVMNENSNLLLPTGIPTLGAVGRVEGAQAAVSTLARKLRQQRKGVFEPSARRL
jgi:hypothetical protein